MSPPPASAVRSAIRFPLVRSSAGSQESLLPILLLIPMAKPDTSTFHDYECIAEEREREHHCATWNDCHIRPPFPSFSFLCDSLLLPPFPGSRGLNFVTPASTGIREKGARRSEESGCMNLRRLLIRDGQGIRKRRNIVGTRAGGEEQIFDAFAVRIGGESCDTRDNDEMTEL